MAQRLRVAIMPEQHLDGRAFLLGVTKQPAWSPVAGRTGLQLALQLALQLGCNWRCC